MSSRIHKNIRLLALVEIGSGTSLLQSRLEYTGLLPQSRLAILVGFTQQIKDAVAYEFLLSSATLQTSTEFTPREPNSMILLTEHAAGSSRNYALTKLQKRST